MALPANTQHHGHGGAYNAVPNANADGDDGASSCKGTTRTQAATRTVVGHPINVGAVAVNAASKRA